MTSIHALSTRPRLWKPDLADLAELGVTSVGVKSVLGISVTRVTLYDGHAPCLLAIVIGVCVEVRGRYPGCVRRRNVSLHGGDLKFKKPCPQ